MAQKLEDSKENANRCICPGCSLYINCNKDKSEKLFCARKKSECEMDSKKICICGACQVYAENNLTGGYFCINEIQ